MAWIPDGTFAMGSAGFYPEERPVHQVTVDGFWMGTRPVTVEDFRRFVKATGYVTVAERPLDPASIPTPIPGCWCPDHWSSTAPQAQSICAITAIGGRARMPAS